jgi:DMSO/TMAO reductase YedYZ molybdopterin-dependent catalytic subunit
MSLQERFKKVTDPELAKRVPPGQRLTAGFPVLSYGETPAVDLATWSLRVDGLVEKPLAFSWSEFMALPQSEVHCDIHCVTTWSKLDTTWRGVRFLDLAPRLGIRPEARFVMQHCYGGYTTNTSLETLMDDDVILAHTFDEKPLEPDHGGPLRLVVPKLYFWKSAKWLSRLEFLAEDELGFWERNGYHNGADPWKEERYAPPEQYRKHRR